MFKLGITAMENFSVDWNESEFQFYATVRSDIDFDAEFNLSNYHVYSNTCDLTTGVYNHSACHERNGSGETLGLDTGERHYWAIVLLAFPVFTVFGNVLVVLSVYREKSLQTVTNYFIVSLATSDIMVALLVMPLSVYVEVSHRFYIIIQTI